MAQPKYRYTQSSFYGYFPPGVKWLIIVNSAIFVLDYLGGRWFHSHLLAWFALTAEAVLHLAMVWQLFTYMFLHGGFFHLLFNMLSLWFFGTQIEQEWGTRKFLKYYFMCGVAAGVCVVAANVLVATLSSDPRTVSQSWYVPTIGASGAVFGVLVAFAVLFPDQTVLMNFLFPVKAKYMVMIYAGVELIATFGQNTGVSTVAHLGGMAFGYLYLKRRLPRLKGVDIGGAFRRWRMERNKRKFQVYLRKKQGGGPWVN